MKLSILPIAAILLLMASCKEKDNAVNFTPSSATDSTYVISPVPAADAHNVLVDEFTGQGCSNCPSAHAELDVIAAGGNVNIIGLYFYSTLTQTIPPVGSVNDLRDSTASSVFTQVFGGNSGIPIAGIDRVSQSGSMLIDQNIWAGLISAQKNTADSINLSVTSNYNAATGEAIITTTTTYLKPTSSSQNLSIVVVEDSIIDRQEYPMFDPNYPSGLDTFYVFTNVFRGMVTNAPFGDVILGTMAAKEGGRVDKHTYTYALPTKSPAIKPAHCRIIAFVSANNGSDVHVLQSVQCPLIH